VKNSKRKILLAEKLPFSIDEFLFRIHFHFHSGHKLKFYTLFISRLKEPAVPRVEEDFYTLNASLPFAETFELKSFFVLLLIFLSFCGKGFSRNENKLFNVFFWW
jgi:hypothetical protein